MRVADNASYNSTFTYPEGGRVRIREGSGECRRPEAIATGEALVAVDVAERVARTTKREIKFERLVSSSPFDRLLRLTGVEHDPSVFTWNKVLVFNLGFDARARRTCTGSITRTPSASFTGSASTTTSSTPTA